METGGCNATGDIELSESITIMRTKFSTLENTECSFFQAGMPPIIIVWWNVIMVREVWTGKEYVGMPFVFNEGRGGIYCKRS